VHGVGDSVGTPSVGDVVGELERVGRSDGCRNSVGISDEKVGGNDDEGVSEGNSVGFHDNEGIFVGSPVGDCDKVGMPVGGTEGTSVTDFVGNGEVGSCVGCMDGLSVGPLVGFGVGPLVGSKVTGCSVGEPSADDGPTVGL